jgi:hypothetical protein
MSDLILPASARQWRDSTPDTRVSVTDDVHGVVRDLKTIDPCLEVEYDTVEEFYVLLRKDGPQEDLVLTALSLDPRVVKRVREIDRPEYDFVAEVDALDDAAEKQRTDDFREEMGGKHERLAHAIRKDLGDTSRAVIARG